MSLGRRVVLALVVVGFAACGDSPTEPTEPEDVSGTYNLQTVNERVPVPVSWTSRRPNHAAFRVSS